MVYHDDDGAWQFFSDDKFGNFEDLAKIVCLDKIIEIDKSLSELSDMPFGYYAHRNSKKIIG